MHGTLTFLTPLGGLVALAAVLPLAACLVASRRVARVRSVLDLEPPRRGREAAFVTAVVVLPLLLAFAAMQPVWRTSRALRVRADAQAYVVIDTSRSMLASVTPHSPTRLDRAKAAAIAIREALPDVSTGVGTMTDRVLPSLLPSPDANAFAATVRQAVGIEQPPPAESARTATWLGSLDAIPANGTFAPSADRRAVVVITDGESRPFDLGAVAAAFRHGPPTKLVLVHIWEPHESIFSADGAREGTYRPDPSSAVALTSLASATGGVAFGERRALAAARAVRKALGAGPVVRLGLEPHTRSLGRYLALGALLPLAFVLRRRNLP